MAGLWARRSHAIFPATGRKWMRVRESEVLSFGRITEWKDVPVESVSYKKKISSIGRCLSQKMSKYVRGRENSVADPTWEISRILTGSVVAMTTKSKLIFAAVGAPYI